MSRFVQLAFLSVVCCAFATTSALAHKVRVYNDTNVDEIRVVVYHFAKPSTVLWVVPEIDKGDKSPIEDLQHGRRIIAVGDAFNADKFLVVEDFKMGDQNLRIRIKEINGKYVVVYQVVTGNP